MKFNFIQCSQLIKALGCFSDLLGHAIGSETDIPLKKEERPDVQLLISESSFIKSDKLKEQILWVYNQPDEIWSYLNSDGDIEYKDGEGYHWASIETWVNKFPEVSGYVQTAEQYHFEMLKLLVKELIWDTLWPDEELPGYIEPKDGFLPSFPDEPFNLWTQPSE